MTNNRGLRLILVLVLVLVLVLGGFRTEALTILVFDYEDEDDDEYDLNQIDTTGARPVKGSLFKTSQLSGLLRGPSC